MEKIAQEARNREEAAIRRYGDACSAVAAAYSTLDLYRSSNVPYVIEEIIYIRALAEQQLAFEAVIIASRDAMNAEEALHAARMQQMSNALTALCAHHRAYNSCA